MSLTIRVTLTAVMASAFAIPALTAEVMPPAQQSAVVSKYCAVCHSDAARNGGLSLEHFDAAQAPPSLVAMLLSKLTGGVSLQMAREASFNANAAALVDRKMRSGAMGAAGLPIPDNATVHALIRAFTLQSVGATEWTIEWSKKAETAVPKLTASILREAPSATNAGEAEAYRLVASCDPAMQAGYVQLTWSPAPQRGKVSVSVDGNVAVEYQVEGSEKMGNDSRVVLDRSASALLAESKLGISRPGLRLPVQSLTITGLFPDETVTFPFSTLPKDARKQLNMCFPETNASIGHLPTR